MATGHRSRRRVASLTATSTEPVSIRSGLSCCVLPDHGSFRGLLDVKRAATWRREGRHRYVPCAINAKACRNEERGVAEPRPGGTRYRLRSADFGKSYPRIVLSQ